MSWQSNPDRAALLIRDMQRYFVDFFTAAALAQATAARSQVPVINVA